MPFLIPNCSALVYTPFLNRTKTPCPTITPTPCPLFLGMICCRNLNRSRSYEPYKPKNPNPTRQVKLRPQLPNNIQGPSKSQKKACGDISIHNYKRVVVLPLCRTQKLHPKPQTLNHKPETLNSKPQTPKP